MRKFLLFAIAISLGSIAFADTWDPQELPAETCEFFSHQNWAGGSRKGCLTCPVRDGSGHLVKCETNFDRDCCWLNTPKAPHLDPVLANCYTNACILGPNPWSVKCICKLNCAMSGSSQSCYTQCNAIQHPNQVPQGYSCNVPSGNGGNAGNGGNVGNGGNGGNNGNVGNKTHKKITPKKPTNPNATPSKPISGKQTSIQLNSKQNSSKKTK